jgi:TolB-like protein
MLAALSLLLLAGTPKVAVMPLQAGEGVPEKTAASISDALVSEVLKVPGHKVITQSDIQQILSLEKQKRMLGCTEDAACMAEVGGALGVDYLLVGNVAKLGASWLVHLKLMDVKKVTTVATSDRRLKDKSIDEVLDELEKMVPELFGKAPAPAPAVAAPAPAVALSVPVAKKSLGGADEPFGEVAEKDKLAVLSDGKGRYVVVKPFSLDGPFFAGDDKILHAQRIIGGGRSGDESFDITFWDPRFAAGYQRSFGARKGIYELQCGEKKHPFAALAPDKAKAFLAKAKLMKPRWKRAARGLARDDAGNYYFADMPRQEREQDAPSPRSYRLFIGPKGSLAEQQLTDVLADSKGDLYLTKAGRLRFGPPNAAEAEWIAGNAKTPLVYLPVPDNAVLIYRDLGAYAEPLGTACDSHLE